MPSNFPTTVFTPRAVVNRPGVTYDADNLKAIFAEDYHGMADEIVAIEEWGQDQVSFDKLVLSADFGFVLDSNLNFIIFN